MSDKKVSKFIKILKPLFKNKLLVISMALYILIPIVFVLVAHADNRYRTAGTYLCYEHEKLTGKIVLHKDNSLEVFCFDSEAKNDEEFRIGAGKLTWSYKASDWYKQFLDKDFENLSREYIILTHGSNVYTAFFFKDKKLYTDYKVSIERGGTQKCYVKQ